jgi:hypothetical protein
MVARHERPPRRLDELAGQEPRFRKAGRSGEKHRELGAGDARDEAAAAVGIDEALDPPRRSLQHGVAGGAAESRVDGVEAADREEQHDERRLLGGDGELPVDPGAGGAGVAQAGHRVPPLRSRALQRHDRLGAADHRLPLPLDAHVVGEPGAFAFAVGMGEGGRLAGGEKPVDGAARRPAAVGVELAEQLEEADPLALLVAEARAPGQCRTELDRRGARLPAPGGGGGAVIALPAPLRAAAADPLGVALGIAHRMQELLLAERTDQEMSRPRGIDLLERRLVGARQEHEQRGGVRLGRIGERPHAFAALGQGAAGVDHRHRSSRGDEAALGIDGAARGDGLPAGGLRHGGKLVAVTEGQDEERRRTARGFHRLTPSRSARCGVPQRLLSPLRLNNVFRSSLRPATGGRLAALAAGPASF